MPQMAPYNWLMMFFMFNLIMMFFLSFNNYFYTPILLKSLKKNIIKYSWQW